MEKHPEAEKILRKYYGDDVGCLGCPMRAMETLENGAMVHKVSEKDFDKMVKELNNKFAK